MKTKVRKQAFLIAALSLGLATLVSPALAHHSFAAYDMTREESGEGTLKEFHWSAPHCAVIIAVAQPDGSTKELLLVSVAPQIFAKEGFTPRSFKTGDVVKFSYHPNRNGSDGGSLATLTFPDGRMFKAGDPQQSLPLDGPPGGLPGIPPGALPPGVSAPPAPPTGK
ncbi:hypothetical protein GGD83_003676 [Rhodoblastus sphagnicola]|uniref:DUF6152 family protein n=1 Tax=Rhodoblastus sphagnicola TaxID=333368 RepID=UPI001607AB7C|nr:DUF6152 family protein [Rhodoblastus sphagnicola]MBB4199852.1 hypothetical protein [Rhodoblastus sphagnicola]